MNRKLFLLPLFVLCTCLVARAFTTLEIPSKTPDRLRESATHIVEGEVVRIYQVVEKEERWTYTRRIAEVRVHDVEKGSEIEKGKLLYVRWFSRRWNGGVPPPSASGHHGWTPVAGERARIYLACNEHDGFDPDNSDGGFNVLVPNGFEELSADVQGR